jgi:broad specificity phosphatase PhoE
VPCITLLRHAQASLFGDAYDVLSELGHRQARALGSAWGRSGMTFDQVYVGPLERHRQTLSGLEAGYREAGRELASAVTLAGLDEHPGVRLSAQVLGYRAQHAAAMLPAPADDPAERKCQRRDFFAAFRTILLRWARGELTVEGFESYREFAIRARATLVELESRPGPRVLAISSGGLTAMMVGVVLGLEPERVIDLNLLIRNCAVTELLCSGKRRRLLTFNVLADAVREVAETYA